VRSWSVYAAAWIEFRGEERGCNCLGPKVGRYQVIVSGAEAWRLYLVPPDDGEGYHVPFEAAQQRHRELYHLPISLSGPVPPHQLPSIQHFKLQVHPNLAIMHFPTLLTALLTTAATMLLAQNLTGLPLCAQACFEDNFANSSCANTNVTCLCADKTFFGDVEILRVHGL
jgi:hypothetical protein